MAGDVRTAIGRTIYTDQNTRLQIQAAQLCGTINFVSEEEGAPRDRNPVGPSERDRG